MLYELVNLNLVSGWYGDKPLLWGKDQMLPEGGALDQGTGLRKLNNRIPLQMQP